MDWHGRSSLGFAQVTAHCGVSRMTQVAASLPKTIPRQHDGIAWPPELRDSPRRSPSLPRYKSAPLNLGVPHNDTASRTMVSNGRREGIRRGAVQSGLYEFHWSTAFQKADTEKVRLIGNERHAQGFASEMQVTLGVLIFRRSWRSPTQYPLQRHGFEWPPNRGMPRRSSNIPAPLCIPTVRGVRTGYVQA